jgi:colanic acid/amylovoran biosynthesis glycosyltransferase
MTDPSDTVAHLVTPYLFSTGSWIHSQLVHNHRFRAVVLTQKVENLDVFPFEPVYNLGLDARGPARLAFLAEKYLYGHYPELPYRRVLVRVPIRILHAHMGWEGARTIRLSRRPRRSFICSFYGQDASMLPRKLYWKVLYRRLFRLGDRFIAEGSHMGRVLERIGAPEEKIRVVHLGIPLEEFPFAERRIAGGPIGGTADARAGASETRAGATDTAGNASAADGAAVTGLIAASFREKKGIPYALEALARVAPKFPGLRLRIIGDGPLRPEIEARAARPDLAGRVALLGYQPYPAYREELARAHFLMAPSVTARDGDTEGGAPVCLIEAQASGLPIVATTHCDIPEVTRPGESALLAPERDSAALADRLEELLRHPERWPEMGRAGRAHVEAEFNIKTQIDRMNEIYQDLNWR